MFLWPGNRIIFIGSLNFGCVLCIWMCLEFELWYRTCFYSELYCILAFWPQVQYLISLELSFFYMPKGDNIFSGYLIELLYESKRIMRDSALWIIKISCKYKGWLKNRKILENCMWLMSWSWWVILSGRQELL